MCDTNHFMNSSSHTTAYKAPGRFVPAWIGVSAKKCAYIAPLFAADATIVAMRQTLMQGVVRT